MWGCMDAKLILFFDGNPQLCFVQGEDRTTQLCFFDAKAGVPLDLTGASVSLSLPASLAGTVRRSSAPLTLTPANITAASPGVVTYPDHGLVTGDTVRFVGSGLPAPLVAATDYAVVALSPNTLTLTLAGVPVALTTPGSGGFTMGSPSVVISATPQTGCATVTLSAACTNAVNPGQMQDAQANILIAGKTRICVASGAITVLEQPEP